MSRAKLEKIRRKVISLIGEIDSLIEEIENDKQTENHWKTVVNLPKDVETELLQLCRFTITPDPISLGKFAEYASIPKKQLSKIVEKGEIKFEKDKNGKMLFKLIDIAKYMVQSKRNNEPELLMSCLSQN